MFRGSGQSWQLFQEFDWAASPLGPTELWPSELRTLVNVLLGSQQPMLIVWGPEQTTIYNDGYAAMCGDRHPAAFGRSFQSLWFDIWPQVEPIISAAYRGQGTSMDDIEFVMHRNGYPEETHFSFSYTPVRDGNGTVLGMFCTCLEITGEVMMRRQQKTQQERFLQVFELSPGGIALLVGPDHIFEFANEEYYALIGGREILGRPVAEALDEVVRQGFINLLDTVYRTGEPYVAKGTKIELNRGPSGEKQERSIDFVYQPVRNPAGQVTGILAQTQDVTERLAEESHRQILYHELGHRLKNQLAMVQAIASQTLRSAKNTTSARQTLSDRISVLSQAHDTVIQGGSGSSTVMALVEQMRAVHDDPVASRFVVEGPAVKIGSRPALSLSLILHELATNATKYGALSVPEGQVSVAWALLGADADRFELIWTEVGGPPVERPLLEGSGSRLIKAGLAGTSTSRVVVDYAPDGLTCTVSAEISGLQRET